VLDLAVARALYGEHPEFSEGELAKIRAHVVSRESCAVVAGDLDLGGRLAAFAEAPPGEPERLAGNRNVLAALLEALLAALFLQHGFEAIEQAIVDAFRGRIDYALTSYVDHKTELQEALAQDGRQVAYVVIGTEGPPHERTFTVEATVDGEQIGVGRGRSKKEAEQEAAREALASLGTVRSDD